MWSKIWQSRKKCLNLQCYSSAEPGNGFLRAGDKTGSPIWWVTDILVKAFISASVLDVLKSGSFKIIVRTDAMVDVHGYVMISGGSDAVRHIGVIAHLHICVGSARCSSYYDGHMPEPQDVGRAMVRYPRFFVYPSVQGCQPDTKEPRHICLKRPSLSE